MINAAPPHELEVSPAGNRSNDYSLAFLWFSAPPPARLWTILVCCCYSSWPGLSRRVCAVNPKNIVRVFGRCRPIKPLPCGWVADKSLLIDSRNPVWFWRTDWILLLSPTHHILSAVSPAPWLEMTVNLSKIVPGVPLQWQWCSLAEIKYLCWPVLRMWDAVMNIIHLDYCTSTCHSIHIILAVYCISKYICMSTCTLSWYQSSSRLCQYSSTSHNLMFCLLQTYKDRSPGCPPAPPRTRRTKQMRWVIIRWCVLQTEMMWWFDDASRLALTDKY